MRLRVEEKIRLGRTPTSKIWVCQRCHEVEFNSYRKWCDDCKKIIDTPPPNTCNECGVKVGKWKSYCSPCRLKKEKETYFNSRKHTICGYNGCKEPRVNNKHNCNYHLEENRHKRFMEEIKNCIDCGCEIGKRKDFKYKRICNDCINVRNEKQKERQRIYHKKYQSDKYKNDEEYRRRIRENQREYYKRKKQELEKQNK